MTEDELRHRDDLLKVAKMSGRPGWTGRSSEALLALILDDVEGYPFVTVPRDSTL